MTADVAIVGAGIVGAACAFEFAQAGLRPVVIDASIPAGGATAAGMGHIVAMDDSEAQFALTRYSRQLWIDLAPELPASVEYLPCGTLWVAADEEEMAQVCRKLTFYTRRGIGAEVLDARALQDAEPHLRAGLAGALLVPDDGVIYPPCAAQYLLDRAGVTVRTGQAIAIEEGSVKLADGSRVSAGIIINAAGVHAATLTPLPIAIAPRKGHLLITDRYPGFLRHQLVELGYLKSAHSTTSDSVAFNVQPRLTGQILIGSSRQYGAGNPGIERDILSRMLQRASEYMPDLVNLSAIRGWTGYRAATPDKLPLIGPVPGYSSVYVAAGHEGLGITTSLATGRLLVDQIVGRSTAIPYEPYLVDRAQGQHA